MINILLANKINKNIDTIESIKDLIEPINNHPLINFKHFDTDTNYIILMKNYYRC